jgi:hypothetical protein
MRLNVISEKFGLSPASVRSTSGVSAVGDSVNSASEPPKCGAAGGAAASGKAPALGRMTVTGANSMRGAAAKVVARDAATSRPSTYRRATDPSKLAATARHSPGDTATWLRSTMSGVTANASSPSITTR